MSVLFEPYNIGVLEIQNRFMRSPTTSYWSDEKGVIRPEIVDLYENLAKGGIGLIVKGHTYILDSGKGHKGQAGISGDIHVPNLMKITKVVHEHGGKIVTQLNHAGYKSIVDRAGPSKYSEEDWVARALSVGEIHEIVIAFGDAAQRSMDAGFDGVQIHGAHGYLISQFLSRLSNRRTDEYGGSLKNRMRLLNEIYNEIRSRVGSNIPILIKMNCDDFSPSGFTIKDSMKVAKSLSNLGIDVIEISGGGIGQVAELRETRAKSDDPELSEANFAGYAAKIRKVIKPTPVALVNGLRSKRCMEAIIAKDVADLISISRPLIREPDLIKRFVAGQSVAECISCNACSAKGVFGEMMLRCHLEL
jgi:2,4-dienoyl-CoA reductase-like NADH-dependent reductase (Old Yellow Enzyme family)